MKARESASALMVCEGCASRGLAGEALGFFGSYPLYVEKCSETVVTPRFWGCHPLFVSLWCLEGCPLGDVSSCRVFRCM
jgi:hypothetical protein